MRIAEIVHVHRGRRLPVPAAFRRTIGLYEGSRVYQATVPGKESQYSANYIITTIPFECWRAILRIDILLDHRAGTLDICAKTLERCGGNILLMEGYGRYPDQRGWWSAVVDFPDARSNGAPIKPLDAVKKELLEAYLAQCDGAGPDPFPRDGKVDRSSVRVVGDSLLAGTEELVRVRRLALSSLDGRTDKVFEHQEKHLRKGRVELGLPPDVLSSTRVGLLMCNTEERFLRFVPINFPVEVTLRVETKADPQTAVARGVLAALTGVLMNPKWTSAESSKRGINIVYTYNYLEGREESSNKCVERSRIRMYLETPHNWAKESGMLQVRRNWREVFRELLQARRDTERPGDGELFVVPDDSVMRIWPKRKWQVGFWNRYKGTRERVPKHVLWLVRGERSVMTLVVLLGFVSISATSFVLALCFTNIGEGLFAISGIFGSGVVAIAVGWWLKLPGRDE